MEYRSPLDSIFNVIGSLPQGHDKPIKHALYNAVALFLLFVCCAAGWALIWILEPFVKPLIWALLVGSALHPLKRSLRDTFQSWFKVLEKNHTPVVVGLALLPINIIDTVSEFIGENIWKRLKLIVVISVLLPGCHVLYYYTPVVISSLIWTVFSVIFSLLNVCIDNSTTTLVSLVMVGYLSLVFFLWRPDNNQSFHYASILIWILLSCCLSRLFTYFQLVVFLILQIVFFGGFLAEVYDIYQSMSTSEHPVTLFEALSLALSSKSEETEPLQQSGDSTEEKSKPTESETETDPWNLDLFEEQPKTKLNNASLLITNQGITVIQKPSREAVLKRSLSQPQFNLRKSKTSLLSLSRKLSLIDRESNSSSYGSSFYLYSLIWACIILLFWKNSYLLPLLPIPILYYTIKHLGLYLGLWSLIGAKLKDLFEVISRWINERHDALVPVPVRGIYKIIEKINVLARSGINDSIDTVASSVVIFSLIVFVICSSLFIALQIYAEAIMLAQMTSNVVNQTVVHNPELRQLLPAAWDDTVDSILDNAYLYGREGISKAIKGIMTDVDPVKSEKLEKQILELWDRLYQSWMASSDTHGPTVTPDAVKNSWEDFVNDIQKSPEMFNLNGIVDFAKQNVGTLMSLLESVWGILKGNINLILGSFSAFLSIILGGGTAVLNFILNVIVFFTTLFYLLSSSGDLYKPVELLTNFSTSSSRFGHALEAAVNGVFLASFKMAAFYGLWTWFIHNLFGVKIVYLPSAFATILGAVPFLGTYWACVPAVLDLWLAQDRGIAAILFAAFQFLPTSIVDTTIYKEIKGGGHPYLTGLAIAGGIFCMGVEGAIVGPLLLCGLYVVIDLSSTIFKETPSDEAINVRYQIQNN